MVSNSSSASFVISKKDMTEDVVRKFMDKFGRGHFILMNDELDPEILNDERCKNGWWLSTQINDHPEYQASYVMWRYLRDNNISVEANGDGIGGWPASFKYIEDDIVRYFLEDILDTDYSLVFDVALKNQDISDWLSGIMDRKHWDDEINEFELTKDIISKVLNNHKNEKEGQ